MYERRHEQMMNEINDLKVENQRLLKEKKSFEESNNKDKNELFKEYQQIKTELLKYKKQYQALENKSQSSQRVKSMNIN